jgi:hypothetical protein
MTSYGPILSFMATALRSHLICVSGRIWAVLAPWGALLEACVA